MFAIKQSHQLRDYIYQAYASDKDLIAKWHITSGAGLDSCVDKTVSDLGKDTYPDFKFFVVEENGSFVGYFGNELDGKYLTTIFVTPTMRKRKLEFWKAITGYLANDFQSAIYSKNVPCIKFFSKLGRVEKNLTLHGNDVTLFSFKREV